MTDNLRVRRASPGSFAPWGALVLMGLLAACASQPEPQPILTDSGPARAAEATGRHFMVATADPAASAAALGILRQGGSAVDAAIAAQAVLGLVEPQSSGIGGGAFLLHWDGVTRKLSALDGRETAPKNARPDLFLDEDGKPVDFLDAALSGRSVGVPGVLRVLELAHRREGRLPWADLFQPAIELAESGFALPPQLAKAIAGDARLKDDPEARAYFFDAAGNPRPAGAILRNPAYAETLRTIAARGADAFYGGPIAQAIVAEVNDDGIQHMSAMDLLDYRARERDVLCRPYRAYAVCSMGPPTSGGIALLQILGILQNFDLAPLDPDGAPAFHLIAEASRLAFADRDRYVADADFVRVPTAKLLEASYLKARAGQIRSDRTLGEARPGKFADPMIVAEASQRQLEPQSTTHFVIVDSAGDIVSMTSSIEMGFGSHRMVGGFLLNNELTDFSFLPAAGGRLVANRIEPGKRPRSSMTPAIVFDADGNPVIALGSPGGPNIIGYVAQALVAMIDWGRSPGAAAAAPHILNRNGPTLIEAGTSALDLRDALAALGHEVDERELRSGLNIVQFKDGVMIGASDPRRDGIALGE
jgi:gamma-glutamyltranspeptidase/glutathione hydrolase